MHVPLRLSTPADDSAPVESIPSDAAGLIARLHRHLNPLLSRSMDLDAVLIAHGFDQPDRYRLYLTQSGLLIEDHLSLYKLGPRFSWLNAERLRARAWMPGLSWPVSALPAPSASLEMPLRYQSFLDTLRDLLADGELTILKGAQSPTRLAYACKIYNSAGSVLVRRGYLERNGQAYRQLPDLATLSAVAFMQIVDQYVSSARPLTPVVAKRGRKSAQTLVY